MDDIISRLSEIEDSSQSYIDDAILKKKEIAAEMNAKKELWKQDEVSNCRITGIYECCKRKEDTGT